MSTVEIQNTHLYYGQGSSDKVYKAKILESSSGTYYLEAEWGRRGSTMQSQTKAESKSLYQIQQKYQALIDSKTKKGYTLTGTNVGLWKMNIHRLKLRLEKLKDDGLIAEDVYQKVWSLLDSEDSENVKLADELIKTKYAA